jgi:hypothetical protein
MDDNSESEGQEPRSEGNGGLPGRDYEVGKGKPPKHTQFKKGNPGGRRPKGARGLKQDLIAIVGERRTITENGKKRRLTKQQILLEAQFNKAMRGHVGAGAYILGLILKLIGPDGDAREVEALPTPDLEILNEYVNQILAERAKP